MVYCGDGVAVLVVLVVNYGNNDLDGSEAVGIYHASGRTW